MAIEIGSIGYNHKHEKDFVVDLPNGPGAYLFLLIKSPALFNIIDKNYEISNNTYVILSPNTKCRYRACKEQYIDDWFFFGMTNEDVENLKQMGIKIDEPVCLEDLGDLSLDLHHISFEHFSDGIYHKELKHHYTQIFFYKLARLAKSKEGVSKNILATKNEKLTYLRSRIFDQPDYFKNIDDMANFMNLSRSGFQHLYKNTFGINIIQDVIAGRIKKAKEMLSSTNLTIEEIAMKCGYKTEFHFMRQFKSQTGFTPTQFRKSDSWNQIEQSRF